MFEIGDIVRVKQDAWSAMFIRGNMPKEPVEGPVYWVHPHGVHRVMIKGCGWQFKQEDLEWVSTDIDISEFN